MSKVVILETEIAAPTILKDLLKKLSLKNPRLAKWLENADVVPLIKECVKKALEKMEEAANAKIEDAKKTPAKMEDLESVKIKDSLYDYLKREYIYVEGKKIAGVIRFENSRMILELAVVLDADGTIKFADDKYNYTSEHFQKREQLQNLFRHNFLAEAVKAMLPILGYSFTDSAKIVVDETTGKETPTIHISAEKPAGAAKKKADFFIDENGKMTIDFEGFEGDDCSYEEDAMRIFLGKMGVKTDVIHSDNNKKGVKNAEKKKVKQS